jgi:hypothetical protein
MPGQRGTGARRARGSWVARIAGTAGVIVAAVTAASILVFNQGTARARRQAAAPLPRNVINGQTVKLVNPGPPPRQDSRPVPAKLYLSATGLAFTVSGGAGQASPAEEWTANQMGGGTYILIYVPDRRCLTAPISPGTPVAVLTRCDLSLSQRWRHQFLGKDAAGRDNWQLRSAADGLCLTAVNAPLGAQPGEFGVGLSECSPAVKWRQIVSFRTAY